MSSKRSRWLTRLTLSATAAITIFTTFTSYLAAPAAASSGATFQDIAHSYAYQSIISLHAKGILNGTQPGYFSPKRLLPEPNGLPHWTVHSVWSLYKQPFPPTEMLPKRRGTMDGLKRLLNSISFRGNVCHIPT